MPETLERDRFFHGSAGQSMNAHSDHIKTATSSFLYSSSYTIILFELLVENSLPLYPSCPPLLRIASSKGRSLSMQLPFAVASAFYFSDTILASWVV